MIPTNIYFAEEEEAEECQEPSGKSQAADCAPRLRDVTNDPLREYAARPGTVRPLPDSVASMILFRKGRCVVENHAMKVSIGGVERVYSSPDSIVITEMNGRGIKVYWCANRRTPDVIYLMTAHGGYLETLTVKGAAQFFDSSEESQKVIADAMRHRKRDARRLAELHAPDIAEAAARAAHNAGEIAEKVREDERIVRTFGRNTQHPTPNTQHPMKEGFPKADRVCEVEAAVVAARERRMMAKQEAAKRGNAADFGRLARGEEPAASAESAENAFDFAEEWDDAPALENPTPTPTEIEKW